MKTKVKLAYILILLKKKKLDKLEEYLDTWRKITEDAEELYNEAKEDLEKIQKGQPVVKKT